MSFWTREDYLKFSEVMMDKLKSFLVFEIFSSTGIRVGELLALTSGSFDPEKLEMRITASYQRLNGRGVITDSKTPKSIQSAVIPMFLKKKIEEYLAANPDIEPGDRMFVTMKHYLARETKRGCAGIRIHDLCHSHVSLPINSGFSVPAIAERMGHETTDITFRYAPLPQCNPAPVPTRRRKTKW